MARSHLALGQADKAEARVRQLLEQQPANLLAVNLLGEIYLAANRLSEAQEQYAEAIRLRPTSPFAYERLSRLQFGEGDSEAAAETLQTGLAATSRNGILLLRLGLLMQETGRYDEAATLYEELLANEPGADAAANNLAMLLVNHRANQPDSLRRALELVQRFQGSEQAALLDSLGWVQLKNGKVEDAVRNLEAAVRDSKPIAEMQYHLGMAYLETERFDEAKTQLTAAVTSDQEFPGKDEARRALKRLE
jgi:predicted Zn-dependent protease